MREHNAPHTTRFQSPTARLEDGNEIGSTIVSRWLCHLRYSSANRGIEYISAARLRKPCICAIVGLRMAFWWRSKYHLSPSIVARWSCDSNSW